jgi:RNase P subunit RPR2
MMKCRVCLHEIPDAARICEHCGEDLVHGRRPTAVVRSPPPPVTPPAPSLGESTVKRCPFCAEEIQAAAIVCKHCRRDLVPGAAVVTAPAKTAGPRWGRILLLVGVVVVGGPVTLMYCGADHQRFIQFSAQRDAWHRKCDAYLKTPLTNPAALACNQELNELSAYAKKQGW